MSKVEELNPFVFAPSREPPIRRKVLNLFSMPTKKAPAKGVLFVGAEKRIRTSGKLSTYTRFPIVLLKPLRHLCKVRRLFSNAYLYYCIFLKNASVFDCFNKNF